MTADLTFERLSPRHRDCLRLVYRRKHTKEIAVLLGLSPGTVSGYCNEAIRILGARDRIDAAERFALHEGVDVAAPAPAGAASGDIEAAPAPFSSGYPTVAAPSDRHPPSGWVAATPTDRSVELPTAAVPTWRKLLPIRTEGSTSNDLGIVARLLWIPLLALLFAIGFGMLATAVRVVSDLVAGRGAG